MICHLTPTPESPLSSPSKHGDRFIPSRAGANWSINFHRINVGEIFLINTSNGATNLNQRNVKGQVHISLLYLQENEKSPSQNKKTKDATSDTGKGEREEDCVDFTCVVCFNLFDYTLNEPHS